LVYIEEKSGTFTVTTYSGRDLSWKTISSYAEKIERSLDPSKIVPESDHIISARYDSPFVIFNRHNEVLVPVKIELKWFND